MLAYVCLLAFIGLGACTEIEKVMPSRYEIESSINRTIEEVEKMVKENPSLPKLSRNDIVSILYNITAKDVSSMEDEALEAIQRTRADYQRALMVVLPHKLQDSQESLKDLYTKPPIIQMLSDENSDSKNSKIDVNNPSHYSSNNIPHVDNTNNNNNNENKHQLISAHMRFENSNEYEKSKKSSNEDIGGLKGITEARISSNESKKESQPQKFTFNLETIDQKVEASHTSVATRRRPVYKGTFSRYRTSTLAPKLEIIYSTTQKTKTTTEAETDITTPNPTQSNVLSSDQWHYYAPPTTSESKTAKPDNSPWQPMSPNNYFLPTVQSSVDNTDQANFSELNKDDFEKIMETTSTTVRSSPIFVTPSQKKVNFINKTRPSGFKVTTTNAPSTTMREEVEELLKSIGLQPMKTTKLQNNFEFNKNSVEAQLNTLFNKGQGSKLEFVKSDSSIITKDNLFEAPPAVKNGVKNLSPEIQLLFQQFGLQEPSNQVISTTTTTQRPTTPTNLNSYTHFKPLPTSQVKDRDFRNFLARFGLGFGQNRNQKAMQVKEVTQRPSLIEAVPQNMKKILENIGLIRKTPKVEETTQKEPIYYTEASKVFEHTTPFTEHIFKPHEINIDNKEQNDRIKNLLHTVKMVQEGKANVQDVQKVAHELLQSTKSLGTGPDPLKLEEILNNYRDNLKNEVKRQQEQTTTTTTTTTTTETAAMEELDETTLASMASTDTVGQFSEQSKSETSKDNQSPSSAMNDKMPSIKPGTFFDTFDINAYTTTTTASPSKTIQKGTFFDTFDINAYTTESSGKSNSGTGGDLEDSFGGSTAEPDPVLPTRPKTGLYFLVDWNSFLEVGEDGNKDKVNLRFAPKVGDRSRFIPVKIP